METHYIGVYAPAKLLESDESPVSFTNVAALTLLMLVHTQVKPVGGKWRIAWRAVLGFFLYVLIRYLYK